MRRMEAPSLAWTIQAMAHSFTVTRRNKIGAEARRRRDPLCFFLMNAKGGARRLTGIGGILLVVGCLAAVAEAADLRGTVINKNKEPVASAKVLIEGNIIGQARVDFSKRDGSFYFWGLPPGDYRVTIIVQRLTHREEIRIADGLNSREITIPW